MPSDAGAIPIAIFLPAAGPTRAERWLAGARAAAGEDLLQNLRTAGYGPCSIVAAEQADRDRFQALGALPLSEGPQPFHFGRTLARLVEERGFTHLAYFGGASAPLASAELLMSWRAQVSGLPPGGALVNNLHSTDWAILRDARRLVPLADRLPTDNSMGWVLKAESGAVVEEPPPTTASRTDFDTPSDLALILGHPALGSQLRQALHPFPEELRRKVERLAAVLRTPAASVALLGRVSENAWLELNRRTQVWARVYAEERGMRASGRQERGEVRSLIADMLETSGPAGFIQRLESMVKAVVWDTRVWMAQRTDKWPKAGDRMAADLGWVDDVEDEALRQLTKAIEAAQIPIVTGGHGVVSGSLLAFLESLFQEASR